MPQPSLVDTANALVAMSGGLLQASYLPTDKDERINFAITPRMRASRLSALRGEAIQADISSISYHQASHTMVVTSNTASGPDPASRGRINLFQPARPADLGEGDWEGYFLEQHGGRRPTWLLGDTGAYVSYTSPVRGLTMHSARACPPSASGSGGMDALIATSHGIMCVDGSRTVGEVYWVTPKPQAGGGDAVANHHHHRHQRHSHGASDPIRDAFSVDYHPSNPRICFAGSRDARVHRLDTRAPPSPGSGWDWFRHRSSAAHVRCLDDHRVLVAGPRSAMAIYDTRWSGRPRGPGGSGKNNNNSNDNIAQPVVQFAGYKNKAHVRIGLDVTHDAGGAAGLGAGGVVAAGLGDGTVGVFSLRTGRRLRAGDVDDPQTAPKAPGAGGVVKALQFRQLPWEKEASLFAGVGPVVRKFTFGVEDEDDEW